MPKLYQFPQVKCSENENFRTRSIAGCRYEGRFPEFRPHVSMRSKDVTMKPPIQPQAKPQPPLTSHMKESYDDGKSHLGPSNVKPLKAVSKLTSEQYDKGKMVAASYEMDYKIDQEMQYTDKETATERVLLGESENIMRTSGLEDWKVLENLSTKEYLVIEKNQDVKLVFRGRAGESINSTNGKLLANTADNNHLVDVLKGKKRDYGYIDELYEEVKAARPKAKLEVISYSNGGPKGLYLAEKYGLDHYSIDPMLGPQEVMLLNKKNKIGGKLQVVKTTKPGLASGMGTTLQQVIKGANPANTELLQIEPLPMSNNPITNLVEAHDLAHYSLVDDELTPIAESERINANILSRNPVGSVVAGIAPVALASYMTDRVVPNAPKPAKIGATSVVGAGLTQVISPMVGAGAVSASSLVLPIASSIVAAEGGAKLANVVLPEDMNHVDRTTLEGAFAGASGGLGYGAGVLGTRAIASGVTSALSSGSAAMASGEAALVGTEMATLGTEATLVGETALATTEGIELGALGAATTAAETLAIEEAAVAGGTALGSAALGAEVGSAFAPETLGLSVLAGAVIGGIAGLLTQGKHNDPTEHLTERQKQLRAIQAERERLQAEYREQQLKESYMSPERSQQIRNAPAAPHGTHLINTITDDPDYQRLFNNGSFEEVNDRIRAIILERKEHQGFYDVVEGADTYPVLQPDGSWRQQKWADELPSATREPSVWQDEPHPNTAHTHDGLVVDQS